MSGRNRVVFQRIVQTHDFEVEGGPHLRLEVYKDSRGAFGIQDWSLGLFQVEQPQLERKRGQGRRSMARKCHPHLMELGGSFPIDREKKFRTARAAVSYYVGAIKEHFGP